LTGALNRLAAVCRCDKCGHVQPGGMFPAVMCGACGAAPWWIVSFRSLDEALAYVPLHEREPKEAA
jgi:hypothetical protein